MDIYLNGKQIEYEISPDATVGEALDGLSDWVMRQGCVIVSTRLDDRPFDIKNEHALRSEPIAAHRRLEVEAQNVRTLVMETVDELGQYLDRVSRLAPTMAEKTQSADDLDKLIDGLSWSEDVLKRVEELLRITYRDIEIEGEMFHKKLLKLGDIRDHINEARRSGNDAALKGVLREALAPLCASIARALPIILEKARLGSPADNLIEEIGEQLPIILGLPERLEGIAVKISIGDSTRGMEEFAEAIASLEQAFRLIDRCRRELPIEVDEIIIEGKTFTERNESLSGVLGELIGAFERQDRVLIGDLIEYEIAPVTQGLANLMEKIRNNLKGACH